MNNQKGFSLIIIVLVVVVIIAGGILVWQYSEKEVEVKELEEKTSEEITTDETADWETYRNEEYGFEIKYPADWNYFYSGGGSVGNFLIQNFPWPKEGGYSGIGGVGCQIGISIVGKYSSIEDWIEEEKIDLGSGFKKLSKKDITVGRVKGLEVTFSGTFLGSNTPIIVLFKQGNLYKIYKNWQGVSMEKCKSIFNQMLSTFKFLK